MADDSYKLLSVDSAERRENAKKVINILKYVSNNEEDQFFNIDQFTIDGTDEFNDPFADEDEPKYIYEQKKKRLSKLETDILLMKSFSKEYLEAEEDLGKHILTSNICNENLNQFDSLTFNVSDDEDDNSTNNVCTESNCIAVLFSDHEIRERALLSRNLQSWKDEEERLFLERSASEQRKITAERQLKKISIPKNELIDTKSQSGIWRMLKGHENDFIISDTGYNIYEDQRLDWLVRKNLTWNEKEKNRMKCENWLKKNNLLN